MTGWALVFLGAIALATLVMAALQVGAVLYAGRLARRLEALLGRLERDLEPILARLDALGQDAVRVSGLAVAQMERADRLFAEWATRADRTWALLERAFVVPAREGFAVLRALQAALSALKGPRASRSARRSEEPEEALFIG